VKLDVISPEAASELFDRRRRCWLAEDIEGYLACFADDLAIEVPGREAPLRGIDAYERLVRRSFAWARPVSFEIEHLAVTPDGTVLAEWSIATERRDGGGAVAWRGMSACGIDEGRITWWREHWDRSQVGL
jgi:ketosteroid isomerase-like protein